MALRSTARSSGRLIRRTSGALLSVAALFLVTSCSLLNGSSGSSDANSGPNPDNLESPTINVALQPLTDAAPFYIAQQMGYFKQAGLTVHATVLPSSTVIIPKIVAGAYQIGIGNFSSLFEAQSAGTGQFSLLPAAGSVLNPGDVEITALSSSNITKPSDLAGKKVGINTEKDVLYLALANILQANNVPLSSVQFVTVTHADQPGEIDRGEINAGVELEPYKTEAARQYGIRPEIDLFTGANQGLPFEGYFSNSSWAKANPKTIAAFQGAMAKAAALANTNRQEVEQILPSYIGVDKETAALVSLPTYETLSAAVIQRVADLDYNYKLVNSPINVSQQLLTPPSSGS